MTGKKVGREGRRQGRKEEKKGREGGREEGRGDMEVCGEEGRVKVIHTPHSQTLIHSSHIITHVDAHTNTQHTCKPEIALARLKKFLQIFFVSFVKKCESTIKQRRRLHHNTCSGIF